jgi:hypothetical protein
MRGYAGTPVTCRNALNSQVRSRRWGGSEVQRRPGCSLRAHQPFREHDLLVHEPLELAMSLPAGTRVTVPAYAVPEDWPRTGEIVEDGAETVVVELDNGRRQELPADEVTAAE